MWDPGMLPSIRAVARCLASRLSTLPWPKEHGPANMFAAFCLGGVCVLVLLAVQTTRRKDQNPSGIDFECRAEIRRVTLLSGGTVRLAGSACPGARFGIYARNPALWVAWRRVAQADVRGTSAWQLDVAFREGAGGDFELIAVTRSASTDWLSEEEVDTFQASPPITIRIPDPWARIDHVFGTPIGLHLPRGKYLLTLSGSVDLAPRERAWLVVEVKQLCCIVPIEATRSGAWEATLPPRCSPARYMSFRIILSESSPYCRSVNASVIGQPVRCMNRTCEVY